MDSAQTPAYEARDEYNQAIYTIRKPKNIFDNESDNLGAKNAVSVFNDILDILGVGAGKKCDPSKSRYKYILIMTDGDVDGDGIAISMVSLLAKHCRPLIDAGMVGRILPPAYAYPDGKKKRYVRSQREFFEQITKKFVKNVVVGHGKKVFDKKTLTEFLDLNFYYADKLDKLSTRYFCEPRLMEYIARSYHGTLAEQKQSYWSDKLKPYREIKVTKEKDGTIIIDGNIGDAYINLAIDTHFDKFVMRFKDYQNQNAYIDGYNINGDSGKTVYDVMALFVKYRPQGVVRFKGLGEMKSEELAEHCMDLDNRMVVIFKFGNVDKDMEKINIIMSSQAKYATARQNIMMAMRADDLILDT